MLQAVSDNLAQAPQVVLADHGYLNGPVIEQIQAQGIEAYVAVSAEAHERRRYDLREQKQRRENPRQHKAPVLVAMDQKLRTPEGHKRYLRRQASVEPVFGIIKRVLGFRQFSLRGLKKVTLEWNLICMAYNLKRLHKLMRLAKLKPTVPKSSCPPPNLEIFPMPGFFVFSFLMNLSAKRNHRSLSRRPARFKLDMKTILRAVANPTGSWAILSGHFMAKNRKNCSFVS
jgi:hypothetical protein